MRDCPIPFNQECSDRFDMMHLVSVHVHFHESDCSQPDTSAGSNMYLYEVHVESNRVLQPPAINNEAGNIVTHFSWVL